MSTERLAERVVGETRDIPLEAAYLREALRHGVATVDDVVVWSDAVIAESEVAVEPFSALSFPRTQNPLAVANVLEPLSLEISPVDVLPTVLGLAHRKLVESPDYGPTLAKSLWRTYMNSGHTVPRALAEIRNFDDRYDLALGGFRETVAGVYEDLLEFTKPFEQRLERRADLRTLLKLDPRFRGDDAAAP